MNKLENTNSNSSLQEGRIDINELFDILWNGKRQIITIASVFFLVAVIYSLSQPNIYKSSASLSVVEAPGQPRGSSLLSGFGGMGLGVAEFGVKGPRYVNTVRSRGFFKHLIEVDEDFYPKLLATESYDEKSKKTIFNSDVYDEVNKKWLVEKPHYLLGYKIYMAHIALSYHQERHIIDISAEHASPVVAKELLDSIITEADRLLRKFDLERSNESLEYLTDAIANQQQLALRNAMNDMIMEQLENQMMTKIGPNYIIDIVDPPYIPLNRIRPNRTFICLSAGLSGLVIGMLFVLMRNFLSIRRKQAS